MAYCRIPLTCQTQSVQTFKLTLEGGKRNINIKLVLRYMDLYDTWIAAIYDNSTGDLLVDKHLSIGEAYIVPISDTLIMQPDNKTLGTTFVLIWGDAS